MVDSFGHIYFFNFFVCLYIHVYTYICLCIFLYIYICNSPCLVRDPFRSISISISRIYNYRRRSCIYICVYACTDVLVRADTLDLPAHRLCAWTIAEVRGSVHIFLFIYPSIYLLSLSTCLSIYIHIYLSLYMSVYQSIYLHIYISISVSIIVKLFLILYLLL